MTSAAEKAISGTKKCRKCHLVKGVLAFPIVDGARRAQKRDPSADYFARYRGVEADLDHPCPLIAGCVMPRAKAIAAVAPEAAA